jgi:hypothetical protein
LLLDDGLLPALFVAVVCSLREEEVDRAFVELVREVELFGREVVAFGREVVVWGLEVVVLGLEVVLFGLEFVAAGRVFVVGRVVTPCRAGVVDGRVLTLGRVLIYVLGRALTYVLVALAFTGRKRYAP